MHFALPPRKTSHPPPYVRVSAKTAANQRRQQLQYASYTILCILSLYLIYSWAFSGPAGGYDDGTVSKDSSILIVTVLDQGTMTEDYITMMKANRDDYAMRHGYKTWYPDRATYKSLYEPSPSSWALIPALRHALTLHPSTDYIWSLTPHALITNVTTDLHTHILKPLPNLMLKDVPVVPPDSVIHTFSHLTPSSTNLILSLDLDNIAHTSFLLRNTLTIPQPPGKPKDTWTHYFLDAWSDPLYRAYAFQKAENHALEHLVQWHPTILAKLVLLNQRRMNSYNFEYPKPAEDASAAVVVVDSMWQEGDLIVNFKGCDESDQRNCENEMRHYFDMWLEDVERLDGKRPVVHLRNQIDAHKVNDAQGPDEPTDYEKKRTHI